MAAISSVLSQTSGLSIVSRHEMGTASKQSKCSIFILGLRCRNAGGISGRDAARLKGLGPRMPSELVVARLIRDAPEFDATNFAYCQMFMFRASCSI